MSASSNQHAVEAKEAVKDVKPTKPPIKPKPFVPPKPKQAFTSTNSENKGPLLSPGPCSPTTDIPSAFKISQLTGPQPYGARRTSLRRWSSSVGEEGPLESNTLLSTVENIMPEICNKITTQPLAATTKHMQTGSVWKGKSPFMLTTRGWGEQKSQGKDIHESESFPQKPNVSLASKDVKEAALEGNEVMNSSSPSRSTSSVDHKEVHTNFQDLKQIFSGPPEEVKKTSFEDTSSGKSKKIEIPAQENEGTKSQESSQLSVSPQTDAYLGISKQSIQFENKKPDTEIEDFSDRSGQVNRGDPRDNGGASVQWKNTSGSSRDIEGPKLIPPVPTPRPRSNLAKENPKTMEESPSSDPPNVTAYDVYRYHEDRSNDIPELKPEIRDKKEDNFAYLQTSPSQIHDVNQNQEQEILGKLEKSEEHAISSMTQITDKPLTKDTDEESTDSTEHNLLYTPKQYDVYDEPHQEDTTTIAPMQSPSYTMSLNEMHSKGQETTTTQVHGYDVEEKLDQPKNRQHEYDDTIRDPSNNRQYEYEGTIQDWSTKRQHEHADTIEDLPNKRPYEYNDTIRDPSKNIQHQYDDTQQDPSKSRQHEYDDTIRDLSDNSQQEYDDTIRDLSENIQHEYDDTQGDPFKNRQHKYDDAIWDLPKTSQHEYDVRQQDPSKNRQHEYDDTIRDLSKNSHQEYDDTQRDPSKNIQYEVDDTVRDQSKNTHQEYDDTQQDTSKDRQHEYDDTIRDLSKNSQHECDDTQRDPSDEYNEPIWDLSKNSQHEYDDTQRDPSNEYNEPIRDLSKNSQHEYDDTQRDPSKNRQHEFDDTTQDPSKNRQKEDTVQDLPKNTHEYDDTMQNWSKKYQHEYDDIILDPSKNRQHEEDHTITDQSKDRQHEYDDTIEDLPKSSQHEHDDTIQTGEYVPYKTSEVSEKSPEYPSEYRSFLENNEGSPYHSKAPSAPELPGSTHTETSADLFVASQILKDHNLVPVDESKEPSHSMERHAQARKSQEDLNPLQSYGYSRPELSYDESHFRYSETTSHDPSVKISPQDDLRDHYEQSDRLEYYTSHSPILNKYEVHTDRMDKENKSNLTEFGQSQSQEQKFSDAQKVELNDKKLGELVHKHEQSEGPDNEFQGLKKSVHVYEQPVKSTATYEQIEESHQRLEPSEEPECTYEQSQKPMSRYQQPWGSDLQYELTDKSTVKYEQLDKSGQRSEPFNEPEYTYEQTQKPISQWGSDHKYDQTEELSHRHEHLEHSIDKNELLERPPHGHEESEEAVHKNDQSESVKVSSSPTQNLSANTYKLPKDSENKYAYFEEKVEGSEYPVHKFEQLDEPSDYDQTMKPIQGYQNSQKPVYTFKEAEEIVHDQLREPDHKYVQHDKPVHFDDLENQHERIDDPAYVHAGSDAKTSQSGLIDFESLQHQYKPVQSEEEDSKPNISTATRDVDFARPEKGITLSEQYLRDSYSEEPKCSDVTEKIHHSVKTLEEEAHEYSLSGDQQLKGVHEGEKPQSHVESEEVNVVDGLTEGSRQESPAVKTDDSKPEEIKDQEAKTYQILNGHAEQSIDSTSDVAKEIDKEEPEETEEPQVENFDFLEGTVVLDSTFMRGKASLGKKRGHRTPLGTADTEEKDPEYWMFRDSTEPKIISEKQSDQEEKLDDDAKDEATPESSQSPVKSPHKKGIFGGIISPSLLKGRLKTRSKTTEDETVRPEAEESKSPGKEKPESSSHSLNWLQALKKKKKSTKEEKKKQPK